MDRANDAIINEQFLDSSDNEYIMQIVNMDDILYELNLSDDDTAITKSIILSLEEEAAKTIKNGLIASLPQVGVLQRNIAKDILQDHNKEFRLARTQMGKEEYKEYVKSVRNEVYRKVAEDNNKRHIVNKYKRNFTKKYTKMVMERGKEYADFYIETMLGLKYVPYDQEVQDQYDRLSGRYEE